MTLKPKPNKIKPSINASDEIVKWITDGIKSGFFVPGQRLIEADIVDEIGTSRSKVRDAFLQLAVQGFIEIEPFKGAKVTDLDFDKVVQIYKARMTLEGYCAGEFAILGTKSAKENFFELQEKLNSLEQTGNHDEFAKYNSEWHNMIIEGANNQYIARFLSTLHIPIYRNLFSSFYRAPRIVAANKGHRKITDAIMASKADEAAKLMHEHINEGFEALKEINEKFKKRI